MLSEFTDTEKQALELLAAGVDDREVCKQLDVSERQLSVIWNSISEKMAEPKPTSFGDYELLLRYERAERRRLEAEVWASEARLNALIDISPDAVFLVNGRSGRILKVNNEALLLLGYSPRELVGQAVEMLVPEAGRKMHEGLRNGFLNNVRKREMGYHPPIEALKKDGSIVRLEIALTATQATDDVMVVCRRIAEVPSTPQATERPSFEAR